MPPCINFFSAELVGGDYFERKKSRWLMKATVTRAEIEALIAQRQQARSAKNWNEGDRLRNDLQAKGVVIEDTAGEAVWKVK